MQQLMDIDRHGEFAVRLDRIEAALNRIAEALTAQALPAEPNFVRDISAYVGFDWGTIGATPVEFDDPHGQQATIVRWGMHEWTRKASDNKFGQAIIFSRSIGKDEYATLIKFRTGGGVSEVGFDVPRPALAAPPPPAELPPQAGTPQQPPPPATVGQSSAAPTEQPAKFLYEMRHKLQVDDREIKRRLKAAGVTGFPAASNEAAYAQLAAMLTTGEVV